MTVENKMIIDASAVNAATHIATRIATGIANGNAVDNTTINDMDDAVLSVIFDATTDVASAPLNAVRAIISPLVDPTTTQPDRYRL